MKNMIKFSLILLLSLHRNILLAAQTIDNLQENLVDQTTNKDLETWQIPNEQEQITKSPEEQVQATKAHPTYYKLNSKYLELLDGKTNRLDGHAMKEVLQVRKMLDDLRKDGIISYDNKGKVTERLICRGKPCTLPGVLAYEREVRQRITQEKNPKARQILQKQMEEIAGDLRNAKKGFIKGTISFMKRIEPAKPIIIEIMKESCRVRNIAQNDTVMLAWANTQSGQEEAVFNDKIKSFADFDKFAMHVFNFLGDLLRSCPKGLAQAGIRKK